MEQLWSYKVTSERWKGTELWGFGLTGMRMGGSKAENCDLRYCCREHSSGLWWQGQLQLYWKGEELELSAWGRQGEADTSQCDRHLTLPWDTRGAFWVFLRDWHDIPVPRNAPAVKEGGSWGALTPLRAGMAALTLFSSGVSQFPGQQRVQALLLDSVCSSSCSQDYPGGACSDTLCCYPTGTEPLCTAQVRTTHQGF